MKSRFAWCVVVLSLVASGCDQQRNTQQDSELARLSTAVDALAKRVESIEQARSFEELFKDSDRMAYLTPGADGYSVIRGDLGVMTVSLQNIEPYANGSRVTLQFGNLTSATINGAKVKVEWGTVDGKGVPNNDTAKSRDITFTQSLGAGRWTNAQVVLEAVPPTDLGFVRIREFGHSGISMNR
jgi:hypothetical protein